MTAALPYDPEDPWGDLTPGNVSHPSNVSDVSDAGGFIGGNGPFRDGLDGLDRWDGFPGNASEELSDLLDDLETHFRTYLYTRSENAYKVLALWTVHTHCMNSSPTTPRVAITSPIPGCGKTTVLDHLARLTLNPELGSNMTPALMARIVDAQQTTLLLDETDNLLSAKREGVGDLVAVLNSGYRRGNSRPVLVKIKGGEWEVRRMDTYSAVALAGIGDHLPEALLSRCIPIELDKALPGQVADSDWDEIEGETLELRNRVAAWAEAHAHIIGRGKRLEVPGLHGRPREIWLPLLLVASAAGTHWSSTGVKVFSWFTQDQAESDALRPKTQKQQILIDLAAIWRDQGSPSGHVSSSMLIGWLEATTPDMWGIEAKYGSIKAKRLSDLLRQYGVRPDRATTPERSRGYLWQEIREAWERYAPPLHLSHPSNPSNVSEEPGPDYLTDPEEDDRS